MAEVQANLRATTSRPVWSSGLQVSFCNQNQTNVGVSGEKEDWQIRSRAIRHSRPVKAPPISQPVLAYKHSAKHPKGSKQKKVLQIISWRLGPAPRYYSVNSEPSEYKDRDEQNPTREGSVPRYQPNPHTLLQRGNSDPFAVASIEITPSVNELVGVWKGVFLETTWPREARPPPTLWGNEGQQIISSKLRLHALLAWVTTLVRAAVTDKEMQLALDFQSLRYKSWCLSRLRDNFSQLPVATDLIPTLWCLTGAEFYGGNVTAAQTHYRALKAVVEGNGGFRSLPAPLCDLLIAADMTLMQTRAIPHPAFPADDWDPGPLLERLPTRERTIVLYGLQFPAYCHPEVPQQVQNLFEGVRELLVVYRLAQSHSDVSRRTSLFCWVHRRQYALVFRIINVRTSLIPSSPSRTRAVDESSGTAQAENGGNNSLSIAATLGLDYLLQFLWLTRMKTRSDRIPFHHPQPPFQPIVNTLILNQHPNEYASHRELTLWLSFIAAVVEMRSQPASFEAAGAVPSRLAKEADAVKENSVVAAAYAKVPHQTEAPAAAQSMQSLFLQVTSRLNLTRWEEIEGLLSGFVYDVALLRSELRRLLRV